MKHVTVRDLLLALTRYPLDAELHAVTARHGKALVATLPVSEVRFQETGRPGRAPTLLVEFHHGQSR